MQSIEIGQPHSVLRVIGSLWFAAVLLVLLLMAMACATVFESMHGTERALAVFYRAWWFEWLLALLGVNILAALVVRYPFTRRHVGFVLTHASILAVLVGSLVTKYFAVDGQLGVAEGQTVEYFSVPEDTLTLINQEDGTRSSVDLDGGIFGGFSKWDRLSSSSVESLFGGESPSLSLGEVSVEIDRYLPDGLLATEVVNDAPHAHQAVEVSLSPTGRDDPTWVFIDETTSLGPTTVTFRMLADDAELSRIAATEAPTQTRSKGTVQVEYADATYEVPVEECMEEAAPLGDTGLSVRVLRYFSHATVGADNQIVNASLRPVNPAVEVELSGPGGVEKRLAFARFPDFGSMHRADDRLVDAKVVFVLPDSLAPHAPVEVLTSPAGEMYVRLTWEGTDPVTTKLTVGSPIDSPWPDKKFTLLRRFERARMVRSIVPADPIRKERVPMVRVRVTGPDESHDLWLQRRRSRTVTVKDTQYEVTYGDKPVPLGFKVTLERFRVGYYPGGRRPRSFESRISILDAATGRTQNRLISMNHPTKYGGYNLYQASYRIEPGRKVSFLSVSRDPGQPFVFVGYIGTMIGMLIVLVTRMRDRRRAALGATAHVGRDQGRATAGSSISLIEPGGQCVGTTERVDDTTAAQRTVSVGKGTQS